MRAVQFHEHGDTDVLEVTEIDRPDPTGHELLVEVQAAGVNPVDTYFREGSYPPAELPFTPGVDVAGVVTAVGDYVEGFTVGDRVMGTGIGNTAYQGSYAEYTVVPDDRVVHIPDEVDIVEAGSAGVVAVTAWRALIDLANLRPAEWCLIHGGSGGVGHVAVQLAATVNAQVITSAAPSYHDRVQALGADTVLDYSKPDLRDQVLAISDGGVAVILDHLLDEYLQFDADVAATGARIVGIGENDPVVGFTNDGVARSKDLSYVFMSMFNTPDLRVPLRGISHLLAAGELSIEIEAQYDLDHAREAQHDVVAKSFLGKLVIVP